MNFKITIVFLFVIGLFNQINAQKDGYWDKERATKKEIVVSAGERLVIPTEDLPVGTTEVVYRITLLDQNQQMANSLVSVLKSIPDPTGISQGSAGAVFLLSKISGEDQCKYAVFSNENLAEEYKKNGSTTHACYNQSTAVNKDVKVLRSDKAMCISPNSTALWFGFESKNWIMNQKIILEVVPWVDYKLSSGWNLENRKTILTQCKNTDLAKKMTKADDFCVCVLSKLQKEYKFKEYENLLPAEKSKFYNDMGNFCVSESSSSNIIFSDLRKEISDLILKEKYSDVIIKTLTIVDYGKANANDLNGLGYSYLMTKQYSKALKSLKEGEKIDESNLLIKLNLAHSYFFSDSFKLAKEIHKKYKSENVNANLSWVEKVKQDFELFQKAGLPTNDFDKVLKILK